MKDSRRELIVAGAPAGILLALLGIGLPPLLDDFEAGTQFVIAVLGTGGGLILLSIAAFSASKGALVTRVRQAAVGTCQILIALATLAENPSAHRAFQVTASALLFLVIAQWSSSFIRRRWGYASRTRAATGLLAEKIHPAARRH